MAKFNIQTTSDDACEGLKDAVYGKTIIITGVSPNSLGADTARAIVAKKPAKLILISKNETNLQSVVGSLEIPAGTSVHQLALDISSLEAVRKAAIDVSNYATVIDAMICTAGVMAVPFQRSKDGIELQFASNYLGHFLLINLLLERLLLGDATVVIYSSATHAQANPAFMDDIMYNDGKNYNKWIAYSNSKFCNILVSVGLVKRFGERGLRSFSVDPGAIITTALTRNVPQEDIIAMGWMDENGNLSPHIKVKSVEEGAATGIIAAFDHSLSNENGYFLANGIMTEDGLLPAAVDIANAQKLWKLSEELVDQNF